MPPRRPCKAGNAARPPSAGTAGGRTYHKNGSISQPSPAKTGPASGDVGHQRVRKTDTLQRGQQLRAGRSCLPGCSSRIPRRALGRRLRSATAAPAPPCCVRRRRRAAPQPFGFLFDKILRQIAQSAHGLIHNLPQNFPVCVASIGTGPPLATDFESFSTV